MTMSIRGLDLIGREDGESAQNSYKMFLYLYNDVMSDRKALESDIDGIVNGYIYIQKPVPFSREDLLKALKIKEN